MITTSSIPDKEILQLKEAYENATRGMWVSVQTDDKFGLLANDTTVAKGMALSDAYLVDLMHHHFILMLNELLELREKTARQALLLEDQAIQAEALQLQADIWMVKYKTAQAAADKLQDFIPATD